MRRSWIRGLVLDGMLVSVWLLSIGLLLLHERGYVWGGGVSLISTLRATADVNEQWFGIYYKDDKVGYASTILIPEEREGMPGVTVVDHGRLSFTLLGVPQRVDLTARAFIDADWRLQSFEAQLRTGAYVLSWSGHREGDSLVMVVDTGESSYTKRLQDPAGSTFVVGLSPWMSFHRLQVGQWGSVWLLNPLALNREEVYYHVRERTLLDGEDVLVIDTDFRGMTARSWVTPDGDVLREESPLGWELVQESREEALGSSWGTPTLDLLTTMAVPINRVFDDPTQVSRFVWLVHGIKAKDLLIKSPWQRILPPESLGTYGITPPDGAWCLIELRKPEHPESRVIPPQAVERYTRHSLYVQSNDSRIQATARELIGGITDRWLQAVALHDWVFRVLTKRLTVGLPSALDVLASKSGDCHEHTILFTALARSIGLPTRMVAGLVYYEGMLYYHAWPEVWLDGWIPMDPTLGQRVADATHLGLIEAEAEELVALGKFVGQLQVEVLEVEEVSEAYGDPP